MTKEQKHICIIWDFDKTLTPFDSTSKLIDYIADNRSYEFWETVSKIKERHIKDQEEFIRDILASDAPVWMNILAKFANEKSILLIDDYFGIIKKNIDFKLYPNVNPFMEKLKELENRKEFKEQNLKIRHFIVTAGIKELVECFVDSALVRWTFGCRYHPVVYPDKTINIPVFCMDETVKVRSLFEIHKGSFKDENKALNTRVSDLEAYCLFKDMIYIGDGFSDVPSLSTVKRMGGKGVLVYDPNTKSKELEEKMKKLSKDKRADLITKADYGLNSELFSYLESFCLQSLQRHKAENFIHL